MLVSRVLMCSFVGLSLSCVATEESAGASAGLFVQTPLELDSNYGGGGVAASLGDEVRALATDATGRSLALSSEVHSGISTVTVVRHLSTGNIDDEFASSTLTLDGTATASDLMIDEIGRIVVGGRLASGTQEGFFAARFEENGGLQTDFGADGVATWMVGAPYQLSNGGMDVDSANRVVFCGTLGGIGERRLVLTRLTSSGQPDWSFGWAGFAVHEFSEGTLAPSNTLLVDTDDRIVVAGSIRVPALRLHLARFVDGGLDGTFGDDGVRLRVPPPSSGSIVPQRIRMASDGSLVLAFDIHPAAAVHGILERFGPNGSSDASYGGGGYQLTGMEAVFGEAAISDMVLDASDHAVVTGRDLGTTTARIARFLPDGTPDSTDFSHSVEDAQLALDPWGGVLAGGRRGDAAITRFRRQRKVIGWPRIGSRQR